MHAENPTPSRRAQARTRGTHPGSSVFEPNTPETAQIRVPDRSPTPHATPRRTHESENAKRSKPQTPASRAHPDGGGVGEGVACGGRDGE